MFMLTYVTVNIKTVIL